MILLVEAFLLRDVMKFSSVSNIKMTFDWFENVFKNMSKGC